MDAYNHIADMSDVREEIAKQEKNGVVTLKMRFIKILETCEAPEINTSPNFNKTN